MLVQVAEVPLSIQFSSYSLSKQQRKGSTAALCHGNSADMRLQTGLCPFYQNPADTPRWNSQAQSKRVFLLGLTKMKKARSILPPPHPMEKVFHAVAQEVCVSEFKYVFLKIRLIASLNYIIKAKNAPLIFKNNSKYISFLIHDSAFNFCPRPCLFLLPASLSPFMQTI